jgi:streptogramin lyase
MRRVIYRCITTTATLLMAVMPAVGTLGAIAHADGNVEYTTPSAYAFSIAKGSDGALWFTETNARRIGRVTTSGSFTEYLIPFNDAPNAITAGPDGALWFTEPSVNKVGRITTSGTITEFSTGWDTAPKFITAGPDGALWFTEWQGTIGRITIDGAISQYPVAGATTGALMGITTGPDGALWFADYSDNKIGRITTTGAVSQFTIPTPNTYPYGIAAGSDGNVWFGETIGNNMGRIMPDGTITEYPVPHTYGTTPHPSILQQGPDGNVWFIEENNNTLARITPQGTFVEYPVPTTSTSGMTGFTLGPDGAWWYVRYGVPSAVGRFALPAPAAPTSVAAASPVQNPVLTWDVASGAVSYNVYRGGTKVATVATNTYTDTGAPEGTDSYHVTAVSSTNDESTPSNTVSVIVDRTAPSAGTPTWSANPMQVGTSTTLTVPVSDAVSGVSGGEYYLGTDPGVGNATAMAYDSTAGTLTASVGATLSPGVYSVGYRAEDAAGNWSSAATTMLVVYDTNTTLSMTGKNKKDLVPSLANGDILPGLISSAQTDAADYGFTVQYKNGGLDPHNDFMFTYTTGTNCKKASAQNCHSFSLNTTGFDWLVVNGTNNSQGEFQGTATVTVDGVTTTNPFTVSGIDGSRLPQPTDNSLVVRVYAPGANPATATPIYQASGSMSSNNSVRIQ